jgi:polysaccharide export outer membrane protein
MKYKKTIILVFIILVISSCAPVKNIAYFQNLKSKTETTKSQKNSPALNKRQKIQKKTQINSVESSETKVSGNYHEENENSALYDARIKPKDLLSITIVSSEPEASRIYNLVVPQIAEASNQNSLYTQPSLQSYLVDNDGNIEFPVFGKIKVSGLTRKELETMLQKKLAPAFSKESPIITIRFINYSVNILGEVMKPGKFETTNDRLTILEGLALAGDLTIYGRRDNVKVLRENVDGTKEYFTLNLMDKNIIYSPAYYLQQNDVVYVEPNKSRSRSSNYGAAESFGITSLSVLLTLTSLVFTVFNIKL